MKKILTLLLMLSCITGCSNLTNTNGLKEDNIMKDIEIIEIEYSGIVWDQIQFHFDLSEEIVKEIKPIETNQSATELAQIITKKLHKEGKISEYTLISIIHSTKDNIWRFEYSLDQRNIDASDLIDCGCLYIAIDGNKGELIKAWLEE